MGGVRYRQMRLDPIAISSTVLFLDDITGFSKVRHDAVSPPLSDAEIVRDVAQPRFGITGDAKQDPSVICEKAPRRHSPTLPCQFLK